MPAKNLIRVAQEGTYSHIYNKGVESRIIFNDDQDYETFLGFLRDYLYAPTDLESKKTTFTVKGKTFRGTPHQPKNYFNKVDLVAYSLMPSHFHLVLHQKAQGAIESFLRSLSTRYSMYFNKKYQRQGALFEGPYKSVHIQETGLLLHFVTYLEYKHKGNKYSSHHEYLSESGSSLVKKEAIQNIFSSSSNGTFEGEKNYKDYSEKHTFTDKDQEFLDKIMLEGRHSPVVTPTPVTYTPVQAQTPAVLPANNSTAKTTLMPTHPSRVPEYIGLCFVFAILLGFGIRNITVTSLEAKAPIAAVTQTSTLPESQNTSSLEVVRFSEPDTTVTDVLGASESATPTLTPSETPRPEDLVYSYIVIKSGSGNVNIYSEPNTTSTVHRVAKEGEAFEGTPINSEWYEIRVTETVSGYISSDYVKLEQSSY